MKEALSYQLLAFSETRTTNLTIHYEPCGDEPCGDGRPRLSGRAQLDNPRLITATPVQPSPAVTAFLAAPRYTVRHAAYRRRHRHLVHSIRRRSQRCVCSNPLRPSWSAGDAVFRQMLCSSG